MLRDPAGEYIMLLTTGSEAAHQAVQARRAQVLAEKLREEVESVRQLQESVIPSNLPQLAGYKLVARYEPSQIQVLGDRPVVMAGGDYYDAFRLGDNTLVMMLGDAAGHGVKACMSIMTMHTLIGMIRNQTYWRHGGVRRRRQSPARAKARSSPAMQGGFITLLYCSLDLEQHVLQWTSRRPPDSAAARPDNQRGLRRWERPIRPACRWSCPTTGPTPPGKPPLPPHSPPPALHRRPGRGLSQRQRAAPAVRHQGIIRTLRPIAKSRFSSVLEGLFAASHAATKGAGRLDDTSIMLLERDAE